MTNIELKEALINRRPVVMTHPILGELEYAYVSAIIYKRGERGGIYTTAELMDRNSRSVTVVSPDYISYK